MKPFYDIIMGLLWKEKKIFLKEKEDIIQTIVSCSEGAEQQT